MEEQMIVLEPKLDKAAWMIARGEKLKDVAAQTGLARQTLANYKLDKPEFRKAIDQYKQEIREQTRFREQKLLDDMYESSADALGTITEILNKREDFACKKCGFVIDKCPECGDPVKVSVYDRDRVQAAKVIIDGLTRSKKEDDGNTGGVPHLYIDMRNQTVTTGAVHEAD